MNFQFYTTHFLIFDSFYDEYLGAVAAVRVIDGGFEKSEEEIYFFASKAKSMSIENGIFIPQRKKTGFLKTGEVGYIATGLKDIHAVKVGDTVTLAKFKDHIIPLEGYKEVKPFVFVSIYPINNDKYTQLREALDKLSLSDSSLSYEPETNKALGFGFRCGFLGLLHADIIQERLEREYNLQLISTTPTVEYKVNLTNDKELSVKTPSQLPDRTYIKSIYEPWIVLTIVSPTTYVGGVISLCEDRRGILKKMENILKRKDWSAGLSLI